MDFGYSPTVEQWRERVQSFLEEVILPAEHTFHEQVHAQAATPRVGRGLGVDLLMEGVLCRKDDLFEEALHSFAPLFDCRAVSKVHGSQRRPAPGVPRRERPPSLSLGAFHLGGGGEI